MTFNARLEVHFFTDDQVSVSFQSAGNDQRFTELLVFGLFTARLIYNLGPRGYGRVGSELTRVTMDPHVTTDEPGFFRADAADPQLVQHPSFEGKKRFLLDFYGDSPHWKGLNCQMQAKGFGFLAWRIDKYAPKAVVAVARHLGLQRADDAQYVHWLCEIARTFVTASPRVLTPSHQLPLTWQVVRKVMAGKRPPILLM